MKASLRRLDAIHTAAGNPPPPAEDELERRLSKLTSYQRAEYECVAAIAALRAALRALDVPSADLTESAKGRQSARRAEQQLGRLLQSAQRAARREAGREAEVRELGKHVEAARVWYRACFRVLPSLDDTDVHRDAADLRTPLVPKNANTVSAREEAEFAVYFEKVRQNDDLADAALDRIALGLTRLHDNAQVLSSELRTQEKIFDDMEGKIDQTTSKITSMNTKLRKVLKEKHRSDLCMYCMCCLMLIGLVLAIVFLLK